jgi:hypothetical protein
MGKAEDVKKSAKEKRQEKAREKAGAVAKKDKVEEVDETAEVCPMRPGVAGSTRRNARHRAIRKNRECFARLHLESFYHMFTLSCMRAVFGLVREMEKG